MVTNDDPWKRRAENMRCKTCMWFAEKESQPHPLQNAAAVDRPVVHVGCCCRYAFFMNGYPVVFVNDWCGDHKLNENSL